jgi:hypothetical protein
MAEWHADWARSLPLIVLTVVIHVLGLGLINERVVRALSGVMNHRHFTSLFVVIIGAAALLATVLHGFEGVIWAAAYRLLGALPDAKSAMLYSLSAITSYGHANLYLEPHWQMMGALEALNVVVRTDDRLSVRDDPGGLAAWKQNPSSTPLKARLCRTRSPEVIPEPDSDRLGSVRAGLRQRNARHGSPWRGARTSSEHGLEGCREARYRCDRDDVCPCRKSTARFGERIRSATRECPEVALKRRVSRAGRRSAY